MHRDAPTSGLSDSLRDTLLARVGSERGELRELLQIAAVTGRTVDHALLAAATGLADDDLNEALRQAVEDYLLAPDPATAGYTFRHALLREAIYSDLLPGERQSLHLRLAQLLADEARSGPVTAGRAAEVAHHFYAAGELPEALTASVAAGVAAERLPPSARLGCTMVVHSKSGTGRRRCPRAFRWSASRSCDAPPMRRS